MADGASREARLIRWSRAGIAAAMERSAAWTAVAGRRPHHIVMAALAGGIVAAPAPRWAAASVAGGAAVVACAAARSAAARPFPLAAFAIAAALAGTVLGTLRVTAIDAGARRARPDGTAVSGTALLLEHPRPSQFGSSAAIRLTSGRAAGATMLGRVDGRRPWPGGGEPGVILRVAGSAQRPASGGSLDRRPAAPSTGARTCDGAGSRTSWRSIRSRTQVAAVEGRAERSTRCAYGPRPRWARTSRRRTRRSRAAWSSGRTS